MTLQCYHFWTSPSVPSRFLIFFCWPTFPQECILLQFWNERHWYLTSTYPLGWDLSLYILRKVSGRAWCLWIYSVLFSPGLYENKLLRATILALFMERDTKMSVSVLDHFVCAGLIMTFLPSPIKARRKEHTAVSISNIFFSYMLSLGSKEFTATHLFSRFSGKGIIYFLMELFNKPHALLKDSPSCPQANLDFVPTKTRIVNKIQGLRSQVTNYYNF